MDSRGEKSFKNLPAFGAWLYSMMVRGASLQQQNQEIARDLSLRIDQGKLLDVGTGPGRLLYEIHSLQPGIKLFGIDVSEAMIQQARSILAGIEVDLRVGNIRSTDYQSDFFDLITCTGSLYLWDDPWEGLEEIHRILRAGKTAYLYETHKDFNRHHFRETLRANLKRESILRRLLTPHFLKQQLRMTYAIHEMIEIIERTRFREYYQLNKISLAGLAIWVRIELKKVA